MVGRRRYPLHFGIHNQSIHLRHGHPPRLLRSHHRRFILIAAGLHHIAPRGKVITATAVTAATILISILSAVILPNYPATTKETALLITTNIAAVVVLISNINYGRGDQGLK